MTYKYALVLFVTDSSSKEIDIVPSSWLEHCKEYAGTGCKYMPETLLKKPKYCLLLQKMVKCCDAPDPTWPTFHVEIRGVADSMEEAEKKILKLEKEPYAFSTDNEQSAKAKAAAVEKTFKIKSLSKGNKSILDDIFSQAASELANEPTEITELKNLKNPKKGNQKKVKKPTQTDRPFNKVQTRNSLNSSSTSSLSSSSPPSSLSIPLRKIKNKTKTKRTNDSSNYIDGSNKRKRISSPSRLSASSLSPSSTIKNKKVTKINPTFRNLNMSVETLHEDNSFATFPSQYHQHDKSNSEAEINILGVRPSLASTKNTVSNDILLERMQENFNSLSKQLSNLKGQILNISADVTQILTKMEKSTSSLLLDSSQTDHEESQVVGKLEFPLSTIEAFEKFNEKLKDEKYKNKINKRLYFSLDGKNTITRNMGNIIRAYISRDVALMFVAIKSSGNKKVFKDTRFFTCIKTAVRQKFHKNDEIIPDIKLYKALSSVLNNAKDWDGHRLSRVKKLSSNEDK